MQRVSFAIPEMTTAIASNFRIHGSSGDERSRVLRLAEAKLSLRRTIVTRSGLKTIFRLLFWRTATAKTSTRELLRYSPPEKSFPQLCQYLQATERANEAQ